MYCLTEQNSHFQVKSSCLSRHHCLLSSQTLLAYFAIALWVHLGPIPLLVSWPANCETIVIELLKRVTTEIKQKIYRTHCHIVWSCLPVACSQGHTCKYRNHHNSCTCVHILRSHYYIRHNRLTPCCYLCRNYPHEQVMDCHSCGFWSFYLQSKKLRTSRQVAMNPIYRELVLNDREK